MSAHRIGLFIVFICLVTSSLFSQTSVVQVVENSPKNWELHVDGEPFYIKGAGGETELEKIVEAGGNTIRTWGTENAQSVLDNAHELGIKVMLGLWVQHERHGFDYNNVAKVNSQLERFRNDVIKYKDHPALLIWCVGNEYELNYSNEKVWGAVNDIAKMIQNEDSNHPVATVTAGTNSDKLKFVMDELTDIDIYGINTYADVVNVKSILDKGGYDKPYMITEWGPTGHWEIEKTIWGSSIEQNSTEKAASYLYRYSENIGPYKSTCIGSFAFLWGQKQEYTSTWYGLFGENGMPTEAVDVLQYCWTNEYPENRAPSIEKILFSKSEDIKNLILAPATSYDVEVIANDLNGDILNFKWELYPESTDLKSGGDVEGKPPIIPGKIKGVNSRVINLKTPKSEGRYRLFVFIDDGEKLAYANIPFYVDPSLDSTQSVTFKKQKLKPYEN